MKNASFVIIALSFAVPLHAESANKYARIKKNPLLKQVGIILAAVGIVALLTVGGKFVYDRNKKQRMTQPTQQIPIEQYEEKIIERHFFPERGEPYFSTKPASVKGDKENV